MSVPEHSQANRGAISRQLLDDHRRMEDLLRRLLAAFEANDREDVRTLWDEFETGLLAHMETEEEHLIPRLIRVNEPDGRALLEEHQLLRRRLTELGLEVDLHTIRLDRALMFIEELRAHSRHEDKWLYRFGDEQFSVAERDALLNDLASRARSLLEARAHEVRRTRR